MTDTHLVRTELRGAKKPVTPRAEEDSRSAAVQIMEEDIDLVIIGNLCDVVVELCRNPEEDGEERDG